MKDKIETPILLLLPLIMIYIIHNLLVTYDEEFGVPFMAFLFCIIGWLLQDASKGGLPSCTWIIFGIIGGIIGYLFKDSFN
tara:strand:+ start:977 stop:1219 length:243 start_codon:yes stop_codon:yes gene_type:complete